MVNFPKIGDLIQTLFTFFLILVSWVFFRANNLEDAFYIIKNMLTFKGPLFYDEKPQVILYPVIGIAILFFIEANMEFHHKRLTLLKNKGPVFKHLMYAALVILILLIGVFDGGQFIYFQF